MKTRFIFAMLLVSTLAASCGKMDDAVNSSRDRIRSFLHGQKIYDPENLPMPEPSVIEGNYEIIGGAFRWIANRNRDDRDAQEEVRAGDVAAIWFDARIFASSFDNAVTYFTNKPARISAIAGSNTEFDASLWPADLLEVRVGEGEMLQAVENCLAGARVGDDLRIFLTPDLWSGNRQSGNIPAFSALAFQINIEKVIKNP